MSTAKNRPDVALVRYDFEDGSYITLGNGQVFTDIEDPDEVVRRLWSCADRFRAIREALGLEAERLASKDKKPIPVIGAIYKRLGVVHRFSELSLPNEYDVEIKTH